MELDVVSRPADAEVVAAGRELADQIGEPTVVGVETRLAAKDRDGVVGDGVPLVEELGGLRVQEDEPGHVGRGRDVAEHWRVERFAEGVGGQKVETPLPTGAKKLHHPVVGELTLDYEAMELPGDTGQRILVYSAEPGSSSDDALRLLASWASTPADAPDDRPTNRR